MRHQFKFEGRIYVIEVSASRDISFYYEELDDFKWGEVNAVYSVTNVTKRPLILMKIIASATRELIYSNGLSYFTLSAQDERRKHIYERFLKRLKGYTFFEIDGVFYVSKAT